MTLDITLGISAAVVVFLLGLVVGLWWGERGRRLDLVWLMGERARPSEEDQRAEVVPSEEGTADVRARERAEISAVMEGLRGEMGGKVSEEELHEEAVRMVSMMSTEVPDGMG